MRSSDSDRGNPAALVFAAVATFVLWRAPFGNYVLYPFTILATWFHEMGHGVTAMLLGGHFERLLLLPDGSGMALYAGASLGRLGNALVAAGGLLGPSIAGALFIIASRNEQSTRAGLVLLGAMLLVSAVIWVRSLFGIAATLALGVSILAIAMGADRGAQRFAIQFLGVQAMLSAYRQLDYLFTRDAEIGGVSMPSDSQQIANSLLLPYWFWGAMMVVASVALLAGSLRIAYAANGK